MLRHFRMGNVPGGSRSPVAPVDFRTLETAYNKVARGAEKKIAKLWAMSADEVVETEPTRWYPKDVPLPKNADVSFVENLFSHRQLLC